ncbi:hypothetical protein [Homoserinimonas sp. A520]
MTEWDEVRRVVNSLGGSADDLIGHALDQGYSPELIMEGVNRALEFDAKLKSAGVTELPFGVDEALPPGTLDGRVYHHEPAEIWWDIFRTPRRISDRSEMPDDYLCGLISWQVDDAPTTYENYRKQFPEVPVSSDPQTWLEGTSLMRALRREVVLRGLDVR